MLILLGKETTMVSSRFMLKCLFVICILLMPIAAESATPAPSSGPEPCINGPRVIGATPGHPFLFRIPATGEGPLKFSAKKLPAGLALEPSTGVITGSLEKAGTYKLKLKLKGAHGTATRMLTIIGGEHQLAQTPPLGWNSWNIWGIQIDEEKVRAAADWMVKSGLASHGYQYINIDDGWQGERDEDGVLHPNEKFKDMKALADYVHSKGLKIGIYSSPGPATCGGFAGSYQHEEQDAMMYAEWGMDYLKYDWCSYGDIAKQDGGLEEFKKPYFIMREALDKCGRDIVFSLCQYGMSDVWEWGAEVGGNLWRTTGDIHDTWQSLSDIGFKQGKSSPFAKPGQWNDPDMLVVGKTAGAWGEIHPTILTQNEQITHITLWSLLAAPLLIGCDMAEMDQFTLDLLSNDDVLDVDQDPLGKAAVPVQAKEAVENSPGLEVWSRPLWDGTIAVGLFNRSDKETVVTAKWSELGLSGKQPVRDLWKKKDMGKFDGSYGVSVAPHGAALLKIGKPKK